MVEAPCPSSIHVEFEPIRCRQLGHTHYTPSLTPRHISESRPYHSFHPQVQRVDLCLTHRTSAFSVGGFVFLAQSILNLDIAMLLRHFGSVSLLFSLYPAGPDAMLDLNADRWMLQSRLLIEQGSSSEEL